MSSVELKHGAHGPGHGITGTLAALEFAKRLAAAHGRTSREEVDRMRRAGFTAHEIREIVSAVRAGHPVDTSGAAPAGDPAPDA